MKESLDRRHETTDVDFKRIVITGIGLLGLMVVGLIYSSLVVTMFSAGDRDTSVLITPQLEDLPPRPRLQPDPHGVLLSLRSHEDSLLSTYGWESKDSGIVRVPIERSMEIVVERGLLRSR
jgi:hypothetical protein